MHGPSARPRPTSATFRQVAIVLPPLFTGFLPGTPSPAAGCARVRRSYRNLASCYTSGGEHRGKEPLGLGVLATGLLLVALIWPLSTLHLLKIGCVSVPLAANFACVALARKRKRRPDAGADDAELWRATRRIVACAAVGLPFAAAGAALGFWLAFHRMVPLLEG